MKYIVQQTEQSPDERITSVLELPVCILWFSIGKSSIFWKSTFKYILQIKPDPDANPDSYHGNLDLRSGSVSKRQESATEEMLQLQPKKFAVPLPTEPIRQQFMDEFQAHQDRRSSH